LTRVSRLLLASPAVFLFGGCASLPDEDRWGEDATYRPGWERVRLSAIDAVRDPRVWIPALGAGALQIGNMDEEISDWAVEHTPVFGSPQSADDWSDGLRVASILTYHASVLATPSGEDPASWFENKAKGYLVGMTAVAATSFATGQLKTSVDRQRPNETDDNSFPSGHASTTAAFTALTSRNLRWIETGDRARHTLDLGLGGLTIATAWARVESGNHFPSDTLFGIALGNFFAAFVNDAFLGTADSGTGLHVAATADGAAVSWRIRF
jgi:membrane-associated phospholipid phosphatase